MTVKTYRAARRLKMLPDVWREPGELVPEAHTWRIVESWVRTGYIDEEDVEDADALAALDRFITNPDEHERIKELMGLKEGVILTGPHRTPRDTRKRRIKAREVFDAEVAAGAMQEAQLPEPQTPEPAPAPVAAPVEAEAAAEPDQVPAESDAAAPVPDEAEG